MTPPSHKQNTVTQVLIVDDHPIVRFGISQLIEQEDDMTVCGEAEDIAGTLKFLSSNEPDIALVDLALKGRSGLELIRELKTRSTQLPVLVVSMHDESLYAERVLRAGARGYITKEEAPTQIVQAIRHVLKGQLYLSRNMITKLLDKLVDNSSPSLSPMERLSNRELQVFQLIGKGVTTRSIAKQLHLSVKTIETHRARIKEKLNLQNASELLWHAMQWVHYDL